MAMDDALAARIRDALVRGDKIEAIKLARQAQGGSLKDAVAFIAAQVGSGVHVDAKQRVDAQVGTARNHEQRSHAQDMRTALRANNRRPTVVMGDRPGAMRWVMIALGLVALAAWMAIG